MSAALTTLSATMCFAVFFMGAGYARHGHVSWWFLVAIAVWGIAFNAAGFIAGVQSAQKKRRR